VRVDGTVLLVGPRLGPGFGCLPCLEAWQALRAPYTPTPPKLPKDENSVLSLADTLYKRNPAIEWDTTIALFPAGVDTPQLVRFLPRDNCPHCLGQPAFPLEDKFHILANPLTGLLLGVQVLPRAFGLSWAHGSALLPRPHPPTGASGCGVTPAEARARMVAEAVERHSIAYAGDEPLEIEAYSDSGAETKHFPAREIFLHHPEGGPDSTGCAAAPTLEMARRHAWLEVLERDAFTRWWTRRTARRPLDFAPSPWLETVRQALAQGQRTLWWLDLSRHEGVTVAAALSSKPDGREVYLGAAADFEPSMAVERATRELLQFLVWDQITGPPPRRRQWFASHTLAKERWLRPAENLPAALRIPVPPGHWVNLTRPSLGVPVVRVLIPGCRIFPPDVPI